VADELLKVDPSESVQRNIRIPGHLWNRIVDAAAFEGSQTFTAFAHTAFGAKANRAELEIAARKLAIELLAKEYVAETKKKTR
jgi:hypothetical protein